MFSNIRRTIKNLCINIVHYTPSILTVIPLKHYTTLRPLSLPAKLSGGGGGVTEDRPKHVKFMNMLVLTRLPFTAFTLASRASPSLVSWSPFPQQPPPHPQ